MENEFNVTTAEKAAAIMKMRDILRSISRNPSESMGILEGMKFFINMQAYEQAEEMRKQLEKELKKQNDK